MNVVKMNHGSILYGTNSESSDVDIKGIFMPEIKDLILDRAPKSINHSTGGSGKNTKDDVDTEMFSIHEFFKLVRNGEMIVMDMLHAPENMLIETSDLWKTIQDNRSRFYTKKLKGYIGYVIKQTSQYSIKGNRLKVLEDCLNILKTSDPELELGSLFSLLETTEFSGFQYYANDYKGSKKHKFYMYEILGKKFHSTNSIGRTVEVLQRVYDSYGHRAILAKTNEGIDWKAMSHAFRACYQLKEIFETGDLKYPLKDAAFIKDIKYGKLNFIEDKLSDRLNDLVDDVTRLSNASDFPETIDTRWMDDFIFDHYKNRYFSTLMQMNYKFYI